MIQHEMRSRSLNQADLAKLLDLHPRVVSDRLAGRSKWTVVELKTLADAWGLTVDDLITDTDADDHEVDR